MESLATELPLRVLLDSVRALGLRVEDVLGNGQATQRPLCPGRITLLIHDGADETGYLDFVSRCLTDV